VWDMKASRVVLLAILTLTIAASAQDWEHCKPTGSYSFAEVKDAVRRAPQLKLPLGEVCGYTFQKGPKDCDHGKSEEPSIWIISEEYCD
jgi:hypothetical protein